ncbi:NAD-dependent epimerase/dehydratase family protein [Candidatus Curtissbacteria bacterium]|nr:NAD-dependent epimerase/dehydratase family protein [Candidatus Curtissbacteria bacterium]
MKKLKVFLSGGSGFIGRNIIENLSSKYEFTAPSHGELDLKNTKSVQKYFRDHKHFDLVIHGANAGGKRSDSDSVSIFVDDVEMFLNLAQQKDYFDKFINLGSGAEYSKDRNLSTISENEIGQVIPKDNYGLSKLIISQYIETQENFINLRLFGIFGKYEDYMVRFISNTILKTLFNLPIEVATNRKFDYLAIDDFLNILDYFILNSPKYRNYNVGSGKTLDLETIAQAITSQIGSKSKIKIRNKILDLEYSPDISRLMKEMPSLKFTSFEHSLNELIFWYRSIMNKINKESLTLY